MKKSDLEARSETWMSLTSHRAERRKPDRAGRAACSYIDQKFKLQVMLQHTESLVSSAGSVTLSEVTHNETISTIVYLM